MLLDERHLHALLVEEQLRPEHFYREQYGAVFAAMLSLYESDRKIDHLTVAETLRQNGKLEEVGGVEAIDELAGWVPAAGHAREYGRIVRENAQMRALLTTSYEIQASVLAREAPARDLVERAERSVLEVAHDDRQKKIRSIGDILDEETDKLHRLSVAKTPLTGVPSGFRDLDEKTGGFQPGNLIVIAARPSMGKSALVANIAENAVLAGHAVALFSLEMSESELAQRFVASQARIKGEDLRRGKVPEKQWPKILEACQRLSQAPLFVDDSSDTGVLEVRAKAAPAPRPGRGRARPDHHRLPAADAPRGAGREPRRAGGPDQPRPQGPRARAQRARDRALAAEPRGRAARRREEADPVRSSRVRDRRHAGRARRWTPRADRQAGRDRAGGACD